MGCLAWLRAKWRALQVELHGQYSSAQLQRFEQYQATASLARVALVCLCTPVPMVLVAVAMGMLRLEPIEMGAFGSPHVWLRQWLTLFISTLCVLQQLRHHLPEFEINAADCALLGFLPTTTGVGLALALASIVGYPLPFTPIAASTPSCVVFTLIFVARKRHIFRDTPGLRSKMNQYMRTAACQFAMTVIYPVYSYVYERLSSIQQTGFVLVLPLIKLLTKNWIYYTLPDCDNAKPEAIVFNIEIFHSLFVSLCMGNTTSTRTVVVVMAVDLMEALLSFHDVLDTLSELHPVARKLTLMPSTRAVRLNTYPQIAMIANGLLGEDKTAGTMPEKPHSAVVVPEKKRAPNRVVDLAAKVLHNGRVAPTPRTNDVPRGPAGVVTRAATAVGDTAAREEVIASARACLTPTECSLLVTQTEKLLFLTEFIVLVEYTEVIMPTVYNVLVWVFYTLPNREFYTFLHSLCSRKALEAVISNVQLYATLEMVSLIAITIVVWKKIGLSVVHQLAFVLEDRAANIQSKLLLWIVYVMQNAIVQQGSDYSFQFKWLHRKPGSPPFMFSTACGNSTSSAPS